MGQIASNLAGDDLNKVLALLLAQDPSDPQAQTPPRPAGGRRVTDPRIEARQKMNVVNRMLYGNSQGFGLQTRTSPTSPFARKQSFDSIGSRTAKDFNIPGNVIRNPRKSVVKPAGKSGPVHASEDE